MLEGSTWRRRWDPGAMHQRSSKHWKMLIKDPCESTSEARMPTSLARFRNALCYWYSRRRRPMHHLEVESKFELSAEGFERLKNRGAIGRCEDQLNVYYDAQWTLADHAATLRIRFHRGSDPLLTLKIPVSH